MKDCVWARALLYFFIASLPILIAEFSKYKTLGEISSISIIIIAAKAVLQGLIAVRAFIDQSLSRTKERKKQELLTENRQ